MRAKQVIAVVTVTLWLAGSATAGWATAGNNMYSDVSGNLGMADKFDLLVRTINTHRSAPDYCIRLKGIAQAFHNDCPSQIGLIGLQEVAERVVPGDPSSPNGAEVLASELTAMFDMPAIGRYSDEDQVGAVVGDEWEILSTRHWELHDDRYLIETLLQHKQHGYRLRFYSAHLSNTTAEKRETQAERLVKHVLNRAQPKELPPIVVGDFNAGRTFRVPTGLPPEPERSVKLMEEHFWRPRDKFVSDASSGIDIIYIGKKSSFPRSRHNFTCVGVHDIRMSDVPSGVCGYPYFSDELTDHHARGLAFTIDTSRYEITIHTGTVANAGTDAQVYVTLYGANSATDESWLRDYDKYTRSGQRVNCFENGAVDTFEIDGADVGAIRQVRIRHDNRGGGRDGSSTRYT